MSVAVVCPTRGRPARCAAMISSVIETSDATVIIQFDWDDKESLVLASRAHDRYAFQAGPPKGRGYAINSICDAHKNHDYYLLVSDDAQFVRSGWDKDIEAAMKSFGDDIGMVHLLDGMQRGWANWPCVSRKWIDTVGWFNPPRLNHYCQDTALQALAQGLGRIKEVPEIAIRHDCATDDSGADRYKRDVDQFLWFMAIDFGPTLNKLRAVMK